MTQRWVIVKYPDNIDFGKGPYKVNPAFSCHMTYSGRQCDIKPYYDLREDAVRDLERLQEFNPGVEYGVLEALEDDQ